MRAYLTSDKEAGIKPYIPFGVDLGFATGDPIQSILSVDGRAGFGVLFDQMAESEWRAEIAYRFVYVGWTDEFAATRHEANTVNPLGFSLSGGGHYSFLQAGLDLALSSGTGRRDDFAVQCSTDVELTWFNLMAEVGVDVVDAFGYNPDFDAVIGAKGGVFTYDEAQRNLQNGPDCGSLGPQGISITEPQVGALLRFRYRTGSAPRTAFFLQGDLMFLGGVLPEVPLIYDDKVELQAEFGNFRIHAGFELTF
jgi:hypothetical protein